MNKKFNGIAVIFMYIAFILSLSLVSEKVSANTQKMKIGHKVEIGNYVYKFTDVKDDNQDYVDDYTYEATIAQYSKVTKKTINLVKKATSVNIVTNGRALYYSKNKADKSVIYKMDLRTKKISKIISVSGNNYSIFGGTDNYLYFGHSYAGPCTAYENVFVYNMKAKKLERRFDYLVGWFHLKDKRILINEAHSDSSNCILELTTESGKRIFQTDAVGGFLAKGKMYYYQELHHKNGGITTKCYQCDLNGKNRKRIKWKTYNAYMEKYERISNIFWLE